MFYNNFSQVPPEIWRWDNFSPDEPNLACPCCGEFYLDEIGMDMLQAARDIIARPMTINSGHRCPIHNARVGGAPMSQHKVMAWDISLRRMDRREIITVLRDVGFTTFGLYQTFIHTDRRPGRFWYGKGAEKLWTGVL